MKRVTKGLVLAVGAVGALALSSCVAPEPKVTPTKVASPTQTITQPALEEFYSQKLQWKGCGGEFDCAKLEVPLDYENPTAGTAKIAMKRLKTTSEHKLGTLVMNPGGPGGSGVDAMKPENAPYFFSARVRENYDVLSFDPRGVQNSEPKIVCRTDAEREKDNATYYDMDTPEGRERGMADAKRLGEQCLTNSPEMTRFASTANVARDLDIMRAALGDNRLNYLGYSYGTYLGAIYADMFPARVGRFVLDGVLDPAADINEVAATQAKGFEEALREFSKQCQERHADDCPLSGGTESGLVQIRTLLDSLIAAPLPARDGRELTASLGFTGIIGNLYNQASWWQVLMPALSSAIGDGDGTALLQSADYYNSREADGTYSDNSADAFMVINGLDYTSVGDLAMWEAQAAQMEKECPTVGKFFAYSSLGADQWPVPADTEAKREVNPKLDGDILLIGTTGDPATPYSMAQNVRSYMSHSKLLTVQGWNHTSYNSQAPSCVLNITDTYLLTGKIAPDEGGAFCKVS